MTDERTPLKFLGVSAGYGSEAILRDVNVTIGEGLTWISGPNGSGKSTLMEVAAGNLMPTTGICSIYGNDATVEATRRLRTYCPHRNGLIPGLSLFEHLHLAGLLDVPHVDEVNRRIGDWGLQKWLHKEVSDLSTGNQRKAWLIVCLAETSPLIMLDEPFNGIDPDATECIVAELAALTIDGHAVVLVAHSPPSSVLQLVTRNLQVSRGEVKDV